MRRAPIVCWSVLLLSGCVPDDPPPGSKPAEQRPIPRINPPLPARPTARPSPPSVQDMPGAPVVPSGRIPAPSSATAATSASAAPVASSAGPEHDPVLAAPFTDAFERTELGADWTSTGAAWRILGGRLCVERARNHPLWLRKRLPTNARIEFDAMTASPEGDLKAEYWGDGRSAADSISYNDATSYLTIFGGWKNAYHVLARIDEHATDRPEVRLDDNPDDPRMRKVEPGRSYHFKVYRDDGHTVHWLVDDLEILTYPDQKPLLGPGHDHFGFNDWDVHACFDNLTVTPLSAAGGISKQ